LILSTLQLRYDPSVTSYPYERPIPTNNAAPVAGLEDKPEWEVEARVGKRTSKKGRKRRTEFLVHWKGYGSEWDTWYAEEDLPNAQQSIADYEASNQAA